MLGRIFSHMKSSRLLINEDKTQLLLFATYQKRAKNDLQFKVNVDGIEIKEKENADEVALC